MSAWHPLIFISRPTVAGLFPAGPQAGLSARPIVPRKGGVQLASLSHSQKLRPMPNPKSE